MHTFVTQLDMSLYPVPFGETLNDIAPLSVEDVLGLSVAILVPCIALSSLSLSGVFPAPALAVEAVMVPTITVVPALGLSAVLCAMAACCVVFVGAFYGRWKGQYLLS
ncbi:hypothetical protein C8R44DRAFT_243348 [Mycena epipterygia]|nr:hypothetical protein C8R44DRAFT_243348 [Mycena epipterygia]